MNSFTVVLLLLALLVSAVAKRNEWRGEILVLCVSTALSFLPFLPDVSIPSSNILPIVLPPILFSAARSISLHQFRRRMSVILFLAFGLVLITAFSVASITLLLLPLPLFVGILIGATVSPPDVISVTTIGKKLKLPESTMSILSGESLINDATALTLFTFALEQIDGYDSPSIMLWYFLIETLGAILLGAVCGLLLVQLRKLLTDSILITLFVAIAPFFFYQLGSILHVSSVITVVIAGLITNAYSINFKFSIRIQENNLWEMFDAFFETAVFAYMGFQIKTIVVAAGEFHEESVICILFGLAVLAVCVAVRVLFVLGYGELLVIWFRIRKKLIKKKQDFFNEQVNVRSEGRKRLFIASWAGMRGVVTLAIAASIPKQLPNGEAFPGYIFIQTTALIVTIGTLLLNGLTLPLLIKKLLPSTVSKDSVKKTRGKVLKILNTAAIEAVEAIEDKDLMLSEQELTKEEIEHRRRLLRSWHNIQIEQLTSESHLALRDLIEEIIEAQRAGLYEAIRSGTIEKQEASRYLERLDLREALYNDSNEKF